MEFVNFCNQATVIRNTILAGFRFDDERTDAGLLRALQAFGIGPVADHGGYGRVDPTILDSIDDCLQVGAAAGDQYNE